MIVECKICGAPVNDLNKKCRYCGTIINELKNQDWYVEAHISSGSFGHTEEF